MKGAIKKIIYGLLCNIAGRHSTVDSIYNAQNMSKQSRKSLLDILNKHSVQCATIGVLKDQKVALACAGIYDGKILDYKSLFRLASISKLFLAIIAMRMYESKQISLDENIAKYLEYDIKNPLYKDTAITVRHLLSHRSSIIDGKKYYNNINKNLPYTDVIEYSNKMPGKEFIYSNFGYGLLSIILEKVSGKTIEELLQEHICNVINIYASFFPEPHSNVVPCFRVYPRQNEANYIFNEETYKKNNAYKNLPLIQRYTKAAGGIHSNLESLVRLMQVLIKDYNDNTNTLLSKSSIKLMQNSLSKYKKSIRNMSYGYGMQILNDSHVCDLTLYGHQGFAYGAVNMFFYNQNFNRGIVLLNGGAKEWSNGKLACLNEDLIKWYSKYF